MPTYKVTKKYQRGTEQLLAKFAEVNDAKLFIEAKLEWDARYKVAANYLLYDFDDLIEEFAPGSASESSGQGQGGQSQGQKVAFSPSPLQMAPRPGNLPPSSFKEIKSDDDKEK